MLQWAHEFKNIDQLINNHSEGDLAALWYRCQQAFREAGVSTKHAIDFFKEQSEKASSYKVR
jgi:Zn-finger domain-containing protein